MAAVEMEGAAAVAEAGTEMEGAAATSAAMAVACGREGCGRGTPACGTHQHRGTSRGCADASRTLAMGQPRRRILAAPDR